MQDPDLKCSHFGILWYFGIFAKKSNQKSSPIFPIFRLSDSTALLCDDLINLLSIVTPETNMEKA